ncbi:MAG TPA: cation transporter [Candidatus Polarisedimenticolia bacterium]|nr:cation transporter [Candidatus Polarisedimenticolia bacterium]
MNRERLLERAFLLSAASVAISGVAGGFAVAVGLASGRLSLLGFGFDAAIDAVASVVLLWRFRIEARHPARAERAERLAERVVGGVLIVLGLYLGMSTIQALVGDSHPAATPIGLAISLVSVILLPPLSVAKARVAASLGSRALRADSILTAVAAALALISLAGFAATEWLGITWADAVGGLVIAVVLLREGASAFRRQGLSE